MDDKDELLGFGSDEELDVAHLELSRHPQADQQPLGDEQGGSRGSASWEQIDGSSQVDVKAGREQQRSRGDEMILFPEDEPVTDGRDGAGDEPRGGLVSARLDEDDWFMSDVEEASPASNTEGNVLSTPHPVAPPSTAQHRTSPTPPLGAELPSRSPNPPLRPPHLSFPPTQLDPFVLPDRLPTIDEFLAARRSVGLDRTNTPPHRKDDLFDVMPSASSLPVGVGATKSSEQSGGVHETQDEVAQSAPIAVTDGRGEVTEGGGKQVGKEKKRKAKKKRKLEAGPSTPSVGSRNGGQGGQPSASDSARQPSQTSTSQPSTTMPSVGDRFPTRLTLLTAVSYASHSLGYTCKVLRYPSGSHVSIKMGCPLHLPARPNRCPASLNATPKGENGEWEVTMCSMAHNHESKETGEWKVPREYQMKKQERRIPQEAEEGGSQAKPSQSASVDSTPLEPLDKLPYGSSVSSKTTRLSHSTAPPPPAPRRNLPPFASASFATAPLELAPSISQQHSQSFIPSLSPQGRSMAPASHPPLPAFSPSRSSLPPQPDLFGRPRLSPPLLKPSLRDLDGTLSLAFRSSTTSAPLTLLPSDWAPPHSQQHARFASLVHAHTPPLPAFGHPPPPALPPVHLHPPVDSAPKEIDAEPSQAEMDAFFGYKGPFVEPDPDLDGVPVEIEEMEVRAEREEDGPRFSAEEKGKARAVAEMEMDGVEEEEENLDGEPLNVEVKEEEGEVEKNDEGAQKSEEKEEPYQLQPIPALSPETGEPMTAVEKRLAIIDSLERITVSILSQLVDGVVPPPPPSTTNGKPAKQDQWTPKPIVAKLAKRGGEAGADPSLAQESTELKTRRLVFPRASGGQKDSPGRLGARELAAFIKVVETIIDGLKNRSVATKRDIFYRSVALFVKQAVVDSLIEDIAATLRVRRSELNIVAASKGLFAGHVKITTTDGIVLEGGAQGALIPPSQLIEKIEVDEVKWVLIIEKEAVFHSLCSADFLAHNQLPHGIILTGKGYPDLSTRELVKRLSVDYPSLPLLCLVDSDPHGLEILSTYKYGSSALAFDRANLAVEEVEWMGVKGSEWDRMGVRREELLALTAGDRKKALKMLKREWWPEEWRRELEYMLHIQRKAEIQIFLTSRSSNSNAYPQHSQSQPSQPTQSTSSSTGNCAPSKLVEYVVQKLTGVISVE